MAFQNLSREDSDGQCKHHNHAATHATGDVQSLQLRPIGDHRHDHSRPSVRYTTDGSTPSETAGTLYTGPPVTVGTTTTIKAIAYASGMVDSQIVPATYNIGSTQYRLTALVSPNASEGSISPATGICNVGSVVSVSATANTGYTFTGFSGGLSGTANPQNITMNAAATVTANFQALPTSIGGGFGAKTGTVGGVRTWTVISATADRGGRRWARKSPGLPYSP